MASGHASTSYSSTFTGTTADRVTIDQLWSFLEITNHDSVNTLWVRQDGTSTPADAVAAGSGCTSVLPLQTEIVSGLPTPFNTIVISVVGSGGGYTVAGVNSATGSSINNFSALDDRYVLLAGYVDALDNEPDQKVQAHGVTQQWGLVFSTDTATGPTPSANTIGQITITPRGTGGLAGLTANALLRIAGTDILADPVNFETFDFEASSNSLGFGRYNAIKSRIGGTGKHRDLLLQIGGVDSMYVKRSGGVALGATANSLPLRTVADAVTVNASKNVSSATMAFKSRDVGRLVTGTNIVAGTTIESVTDSTHVVLDTVATGSGSGGTLTLPVTSAGSIYVLTINDAITGDGKVIIGDGTKAATDKLTVDGGSMRLLRNGDGVLGTMADGTTQSSIIVQAATDHILIGGTTTNTNSHIDFGSAGVIALTVAYNAITPRDGADFVFGTVTGTRLGTAADQKIGAYGTPGVVRPTGVPVTAAGIHAALVSIGWIAA